MHDQEFTELRGPRPNWIPGVVILPDTQTALMLTGVTWTGMQPWLHYNHDILCCTLRILETGDGKVHIVADPIHGKRQTIITHVGPYDVYWVEPSREASDED